MTCLEQRTRQLEELKHTSINPLTYVVEWYYPGIWSGPAKSWRFDSIEEAEEQREIDEDKYKIKRRLLVDKNRQETALFTGSQRERKEMTKRHYQELNALDAEYRRLNVLDASRVLNAVEYNDEEC